MEQGTQKDFIIIIQTTMAGSGPQPVSGSPFQTPPLTIIVTKLEGPFMYRMS